MTRLLKRKSELYKKTNGTINRLADAGDKANQSRAEECDIKRIIEKFGILPIEMLNKAKEPLYLDTLDIPRDINARLQEKYRVEDYFESLPAAVRKEYNDSADVFYNKIQLGDYELAKKYNILENSHINSLEERRLKTQKEIESLQNQINKLKEENLNVYNQATSPTKDNTSTASID